MLRALFLSLLLAPALQAQFPGASWERLTDDEATSAGWSRTKLAEAREFSATLNTEAVMIVQGGKVLDSWGAVDQKFNIHSIRKSFLSALCGIQVAAGKLNPAATLAELGIDDNEPVLTELEKTATVLQLLQARSGVYHPALYETARMKARRPERHSHAPGTFWYYNNWDFNALGTIYEQVTGSGIYDDIQKLLAAPLGMEDYQPSDGEYFTGPDSIHRAYPLRLTARDMARFGLLYLNGGQWNGQQIVPASWVKDSVAASSEAGAAGGYGYLWWVSQNGVHFSGATLPEGSYSARGSGGHYMVVIPPLDLVIVHRVNTDISDREVSNSQFGDLLRRILLAYQPPSKEASVPQVLKTQLPLLMNRHQVPGVAVVGIENRHIAWSQYRGLREAGKDQRVDENTVFEAASMTKPLAAYAALKLVEQGKLDLDKPLVSYLGKPYLENEPLHQKITARMVLNHTSGFPNWRDKNGPLKVLHEPGTQFLYSGEGLQFLQTAITRITGEDYENFMQSTLLKPLGMNSSHHVWQEAYATTAAAGHTKEGKVKPDRKLYTKPNAAYTLYCTPRDYAAFVLEMMNPDRAAPWSLSAESLRTMLTPASPSTGRPPLTRRGVQGTGEVRFGLGWSIEPTPSGDRIRHSGSNGTGFRSYVEFDPVKGHGLVIMTNSDSGDALWNDLVSLIGVP